MRGLRRRRRGDLAEWPKLPEGGKVPSSYEPNVRAVRKTSVRPV